VTPQKVEGHDHFYGFSRFSKECMPWDYPNMFFWMDIDCVFPNIQTGDIHIIEMKCNDAEVKPYQHWILDTLAKKGCKTHILRLSFDQKYYGDHANLGDPRLANKITLDDKEITVDVLIRNLTEWHGIKIQTNLNNSLQAETVEKGTSK